MSLNLKHIPCPAGDGCTAFQCIFGHNKDKEAQRPKEMPHLLPVPKTDPSFLDSSLPRKRTRVDSDPASENLNSKQKSSKLSVAPGETATITKQERDSESHLKQPVKSATKPISPPPLKRQAPKPSAEPGSASSTACPLSIPSAKKSTSSATQKPLKAESLNPRLLKSSPASHEVRLKLLRMLHAEYTRLNKELKKDANDNEEKLLFTDQELITRTLDEEQAVAVGQGPVYSNIMKNKVMQFKRMNVAKWKEEREKEKAAEIKKKNGSERSEEPKKIKTGLTPAQEVQILPRLLTPIDNLAKHGYVPAVPSEEAIKSAREGKEAGHGWEKCDRCQQRFQVFPGRREEDGALTSGGSCKFHWGKPYIPTKPPGDNSRPPKRYQCCGEDVGESAGCFTRDHHVYKLGDGKTLATVLNFAETPENPNAPTDRAVGFDCEMGYTVQGMELIRLTAVSWPTGEELLDVLVRPLGEILDLNSRYSGVWPEDMARAKPWSSTENLTPSKSGETESVSEDGEIKSRSKDLRIVSSPEIARELLFSLISPSTPLIGHGLENDLNSVRIVHPTVVDTVLLYPHKRGLPFRNGLKMLMDHHLNRKIQQDMGPKMMGHDSAEDARAAGDLVRIKVASEWGAMRRAGWKIEDGELVAPEA